MMRYKTKILSLFNGKEVRGASALASSSIIAQGIALLVTPILSRLYEPEAFGYLTLVVSITGMVTPAIALRLESALMLDRRDDVASALFALGLIAATLISGLTILGLEICFFLGLLEPMAKLSGFSLWVGGITFLSGLFILLGQFALRERNYQAVASRNITQGFSTSLAQLGLAATGLSASGLIIGFFVGRLAGVVPLIKSARSQIRTFSRADMRYGLYRYRSFPLIFAPAALLNASALAAPILFVGVYLEVKDAGQYGMAERVLAVPIVIVAAALGQIVEARLAFHYREQVHGSSRYYLQISMLLAGFSLVVGAVVWIWAPTLIPFILGPEWQIAASIMQLLVPMLMTRLIASPLSKALVVTSWARATLMLDIVRALVIAVILYVCFRTNASLEAVVISTSLSFTVVYVATWIVGLSAVQNLDSKVKTVE
ncbi:lipopolysaccharide biosynthesis protein [Glutamicibacter nicotianae]|uniref:lipopolysaccharide biosynthesis protein n=1 Tax=Glutamicibacter nicotianae TaxID=37929 RepID=UPI002553C1C2|nr:oligosaccharide flippase family protein [Glutamicibacter nicotianae]WIV45293.1 oligosaccharide flippase family protein [Glutamicibacter nicotianae]